MYKRQNYSGFLISANFVRWYDLGVEERSIGIKRGSGLKVRGGRQDSGFNAGLCAHWGRIDTSIVVLGRFGKLGAAVE